MQGIEIPIGAPLGQLDKDLKSASSKLNQFAKDASNSAGVLGGSVVKGSNSAAFALTNLGRVAQDAPFGFIGIQNNLNPLLESFQRLKAETGTTGGALKALGQTLIGPAGLGIALSVVSAGILFYQQYQQRANKEVTNAKKVTDEYINSLGQVQQAQLKGAQSAQGELTTLKLLYNQYQNATLPLEQRKDAYKEIQKLYPSYFGNMAFEATATDKTKKAYNLLTDSILASARARAAADLITKNSTRQLENEQKIVDLNAQIQSERTKQLKLQSTVESQNLLAKQEANILTSKQRDIVNQYLTAGAKEAELNKLKNNLLTDTNKLTEKNLLLEKSVNAETLKGAKISGDIGGDAIKKTKQKDFKRDPQFVAKPSLNELDAFLEAYRKTEAQLNKTPLVPFPGLKEKLAQVNLLLVEFNKGASEIIQNSITNTFNNLGSAIGEALATGGNVLQSIGQTILQGLSGFLSEMGGLLIKYGTLAVLKGKLDLAILTGGPVAIGAGLAAIGAGIALKAAGSAIGSLANNKKDVSLPNQSNSITTSASSSFTDFGGGRVVFEISGTNLIGVLNRAGAKLQRFG